MDLIVCSWCQSQNPAGATACVLCGAPLDDAVKVSDGGWREAPRLHDMAEFSFGTSTCQVEGDVVPVAELNLGQGDSIYFEHHVLLWKDEAVPITAMNTPGRSLGGMPSIVTVAAGPGRVAVSRDAAGEMVVLPMHPSMEIDVREHAFLAASASISYSFVRIKGLTNILHGGQGMYIDRFVTQGGPGLLLLHGNGNVFERLLAPGEKIRLEPGAFLFKDASVQMDTFQLPVKTGVLSRGMYLAEMTGPGRIGIQSMYVHHGATTDVDASAPERSPSNAATYTCPYCRLDGDATGDSCTHCGAPVDIRARVSQSGWEKQPAIKDMAKIQFGQSSCQVSGLYVPAAELRLAAGESVYFSHDSLLWCDMQVVLGSQPLKGAWTRKKAGLPLVMMEATGPGQLALADNDPGETIAVPLMPGRSVEVREHRFLMATENVTYDWFQTNIWYRASEGGGGGGGGMKSKAIGGGLGMLANMVLDTEIETGEKNEVTTHYPAGNYLDRFSAGETPGLLLLHGRGNVFTRDLAEGQTICVHAGAFVWKDSTVGMGLHLERPKSGGWFVGWQPATPWLRMWGPGRVAVSSAYEPTEGTGRILNTSQATEVDWNYQMPPHLAGIGSVRSAVTAASTHDDSAFEAALDAFATSQGFTAGKDRNLAAIHSHAYSHPGGIEVTCRVVDTAASVAAVSSMTGMLGSRMSGLTSKLSAKMEQRLGAPSGGEPIEGLGVPATWKQTGDDSASLSATKNGKVFSVQIKARMAPQDMQGWARAFAAAGLAAMQ